MKHMGQYSPWPLDAQEHQPQSISQAPGCHCPLHHLWGSSNGESCRPSPAGSPLPGDLCPCRLHIHDGICRLERCSGHGSMTHRYAPVSLDVASSQALVLRDLPPAPCVVMSVEWEPALLGSLGAAEPGVHRPPLRGQVRGTGCRHALGQLCMRGWLRHEDLGSAHSMPCLG